MATPRRAAPSRTPARPTRRRMSDDELRTRNMTPFLRPEHVREGEWLQLTGFNAVRPDGQYAIEVENERGLSYTLGIRQGSPDHRVMFKAFGPALSNWTGAVQVTIQKGRVEGTSFVNVKAADAGLPEWADSFAPPHDDDDAPRS